MALKKLQSYTRIQLEPHVPVLPVCLKAPQGTITRFPLQSWICISSKFYKKCHQKPKVDFTKLNFGQNLIFLFFFFCWLSDFSHIRQVFLFFIFFSPHCHIHCMYIIYTMAVDVLWCLIQTLFKQSVTEHFISVQISLGCFRD